jgi:hypothetical protein
MEEIILHAMERDPKKRYQTAAAMKTELDDPTVVQFNRQVRPASGADGLEAELEKSALACAGHLDPPHYFRPRPLADHPPRSCALTRNAGIRACLITEHGIVHLPLY